MRRPSGSVPPSGRGRPNRADGHIRFGRGVALNHPNPRAIGKAGEIFRRFRQIGVADVGGRLAHQHGRSRRGDRTAPLRLADLLDLPYDVIDRQTRYACILWPPLSVREMAHCAGADLWLTAMSDDVRHRRVIRRKPVARVEQVRHFMGREASVAPRQAPLDPVVRRRLDARIEDRKSPRWRSVFRSGQRQAERRHRQAQSDRPAKTARSRTPVSHADDGGGRPAAIPPHRRKAPRPSRGIRATSPPSRPSPRLPCEDPA